MKSNHFVSFVSVKKNRIKRGDWEKNGNGVFSFSSDFHVHTYLHAS